jgi:hypothetical protein
MSTKHTDTDEELRDNRLETAVDTLISVALDLGKQAKVITLADVHTPQAIPDSVKLQIALNPYKNKVLALHQADRDIAIRNKLQAIVDKADADNPNASDRMYFDVGWAIVHDGLTTHNHNKGQEG